MRIHFDVRVWFMITSTSTCQQHVGTNFLFSSPLLCHILFNTADNTIQVFQTFFLVSNTEHLQVLKSSKIALNLKCKTFFLVPS